MTVERSGPIGMVGLPSTYRVPYDLGTITSIGKVCLDTGCGYGILTDHMGTDAAKMIGIDYCEEVIREANHRFSSHASFQVMDCRKLEFDDNMFDVVLSFEFIEHLNEEDQHKYLREVIRVLKPDGIMCLSTPNRADTDKYNLSVGKAFDNEFHLREMHTHELCKLMGQYFHRIKFIQTSPYFVCELRP